MAATATFRIWRGDGQGGTFQNYPTDVSEGMVVLDAVHQIQAQHANDLAVRWNCKAGKCGSCSAEVNGNPRLMCKTRLADFGSEISVRPMHTFPVIKDLVTDVSWNYEVNKRIPKFTPSEKDAFDPQPWRMQQEDVDRITEFRKCIECFLCQDVCHVLRDHDRKDAFFGPRFMIRIAGLEMHPKDSLDRRPLLKGEAGIGMCNITKCCQEVCPEHIKITDNAIIPLKERTASDVYDPVVRIARKINPFRAAPVTADLTGAKGNPAIGPQRFSVKDVVRLKTRGHRLARVGSVLPDGKLEVWVLHMNGTVQHWDGPKVVRTSDVANNYGPLDDVGIGAKLVEQYITEDHKTQHGE